MKGYLKKWDIMRIFRLVIGIVIVVQGIQAQEWFIVGLGALFSLFPLFNVSMCGARYCGSSIPQQKAKAYKSEDVTYEEVK